MDSRPSASVPFFLTRSEDAFSAATVTTTTETIHGLLRIDGPRLVVQWRLDRRTDRVGATELRTDRDFEEVREVVVPLSSVAGARVRHPGWAFWSGPRLVLHAADLQAFDALAGAGGLELDHPAELVLRVRRADRLAAEEFTAELALALAQLDDAGGWQGLGPADAPGAGRLGDPEDPPPSQPPTDPPPHPGGR